MVELEDKSSLSLWETPRFGPCLLEAVLFGKATLLKPHSYQSAQRFHFTTAPPMPEDISGSLCATAVAMLQMC